MDHKLFASKRIDMRTRKPGLGSPVTIDVVEHTVQGYMVNGEYSGRLIGIYANSDGEGFYIFEGDVVIPATGKNFSETGSATVTDITDYDAA